MVGASPEVAGQEAACSVIGGPFAMAMQALLFTATCGVLVWKKYNETSSRSWFEFFLDGSKQFCGAGWIHVANMLCAILFADDLPGVDGCVWYAANIIVDDTAGVFVLYALQSGFDAMRERCFPACLVAALESGSYFKLDSAGQKTFRPVNYVCQLMVWLFFVTCMKLSMVAFMKAVPPMELFFDFLLSPLDSNRDAKLFVVMLIIPFLMNALQFFLVDNIIKKKDKVDPNAGKSGASLLIADSAAE
jgi:hypothetical protein